MSKRKPKDRGSAPTYTSDDLCALLSCCQRTLKRKIDDEGAPAGTKVGRELIYNKPAWDAWIRKHYPQVMPEPEATEMSESDKRWDLLIRQHALDKEAEALNETSKTPNTKKPQRRKVAKRKK